jgi:hypothetical protein
VKYMLFIHADPTVQLSAKERAGIPAAVSAWVAEMEERRVRLLGDVLQPVSEAATVEVRAGEVSVRRGPLVDAERQISGFNILECEDLDRGARGCWEASCGGVWDAGVEAIR